MLEYAVHGSGLITTRPLKLPADLGANSSLFVGFVGHSLRCEVLLAEADDALDCKAVCPHCIHKHGYPMVRRRQLLNLRAATMSGGPANLSVCHAEFHPCGLL
eukprot:SAG31_NODE_26064_length_449_cov_0.877143_1_plen_103_part_00